MTSNKYDGLIVGVTICLTIIILGAIGTAESVQPILVTASTEFSDIRIVVDNSSGDMIIDQTFLSATTRTSAVVYLNNLNGSYQHLHNYSLQVNEEDTTWVWLINDTMDYLGRGSVFDNITVANLTINGLGAYTKLYTNSDGFVLGGTDADTTYTASGTLLDLTGTTLSVNEGTLTDGKLCFYNAGTGIECTLTDSDTDTTYQNGTGILLTSSTFSVDTDWLTTQISSTTEDYKVYFWNDSTGTIYSNDSFKYINVTGNFSAETLLATSTNLYINGYTLPSTTTDYSGASIIGVSDGQDYWQDDNVQDILETIAIYLDINGNLTWRRPVKDKDLGPGEEPVSPEVGDRYIIDGAVGGDWYPNLPYRDNLSVQGLFITADMVNYTILLKYDDCGQNRNLFTLAAENGTDITFTLPDHVTKLDHELVNYRNTSGNCYMEAYVRLPNMTFHTDRYFDMAYGNSTLAMIDGPAENKYDAWDSYYETVAHMEWDEGTSGWFQFNMTDSTRYDNNITAYKCVQNYSSGGIVGGYVHNNENGCPGTWMNTSVDRELSGTADNFNFTVSLWGSQCELNNVYAATVPDQGSSDPEGSGGYSSNIILGYSSHRVWFNGNTRGSGTNILGLVDWHMLGYSANGTEGIVYEDGIMSADWYARTKNTHGITFETMNLFAYGVDGDAIAGRTYFGKVDEFRFSTTIRGAEWYQMEANNMRYSELFIINHEHQINPGGGGTAWDGYETHIAEWDGVDWQLPNAPDDGWATWVVDEKKIYTYSSDTGTWFAIDTVGQSHDQLQNLYGCDPDDSECWHFMNEEQMEAATRVADGLYTGLANAGWSILINNAYQAGAVVDWDFLINDNNATLSMIQSLDSKGYRLISNGTRMYLDFGHEDAGFQYQNNIMTITNLSVTLPSNIIVTANGSRITDVVGVDNRIGSLISDQWCAADNGATEINCDQTPAITTLLINTPITGGGISGTVTVGFDAEYSDSWTRNDTELWLNASLQGSAITNNAAGVAANKAGLLVVDANITVLTSNVTRAQQNITDLWSNATDQDTRIITLEGRALQPKIWGDNISTSCTAGQILKNQSGSWQCANDATAGGAAVTAEWTSTATEILSNQTMQLVNVSRNLSVEGQIQRGITDIYYCPELLDDSATSILAGLVMSPASTESGTPNTQIDCPRNIVWDTYALGIMSYTCSGTVNIWGIDTNGYNISDTMAFTGSNGGLEADNGWTDQAYARVTRWSVTENGGDGNCMNVAVNIGSGTYIGMPNYPTNSAPDYFKIMNDTVDITTLPDWINETYGTINFATYLSTNRDELTVWARHDVRQT